MDLARAIHEQWAANGDLNAALSAARVMTGTYWEDEPDFPYAIIRTTGDTPVAQANNGSAVDEINLEIIVSHDADSYDELREIVHRVKQAFNRADFNMSESCKVIDVERQTDYPIQDEDTRVWDWYMLFVVRAYLPAGV